MTSAEARARAVTSTWQDARSTRPSAAQAAAGRKALTALHGDVLAYTAHLLAEVAPAPVRVAVTGDSVGFTLAYEADIASLPHVVTGTKGVLGSAARIGCGLLAARGYRWPSDRGGYDVQADGRCGEAPSLELSMIARYKPAVVVMVHGSWEYTSIMDPGLHIIAARSATMRSLLVAEFVRRIDSFTKSGVQRVLLPVLACPGPRVPPARADRDYRSFYRSVLVAVVAARPRVAVIPPVPATQCEGGNPDGAPSAAFGRATAGDVHWRSGSAGASWAWRELYGPSIADVAIAR